MKVTPNPPVVEKYTIELSRTELLHIAYLLRRNNSSMYFASLPSEIQEVVTRTYGPGEDC